MALLYVYDTLCGILAVFLAWNLWEETDRSKQALYALTLVPFVLRALGLR